MKKTLKKLLFIFEIFSLVFSINNFLSIENNNVLLAEESQYIQLADGYYQNNPNYNYDVSAIPTSFDLRDEIYIEVENQGSYGICWAYSSLSTLETHIALRYNEYYDFSEIHLASAIFEYNDYNGISFTAGGSYEYFQFYCDKNLGPILDDEMSYEVFSKDDLETPISEYEQYAIKYDQKNKSQFTKVVNACNFVEFVTTKNSSEAEKQSTRDSIKHHIMNNGGCDTTVISALCNLNTYNEEYYNTHYIYNAPSTFNAATGLHALTLIGWDDNYTDGIHTGAYIALNSWGKYWGDNGFVYVFYDDYTVEWMVSGVLDVDLCASNYQINNLQDIFGRANQITLNNFATVAVPINLSKKKNEYMTEIEVPISLDPTVTPTKFYVYFFEDSDLSSILNETNSNFVLNFELIQPKLIRLYGAISVIDNGRFSYSKTRLKLNTPTKISHNYAFIIVSGYIEEELTYKSDIIKNSFWQTFYYIDKCLTYDKIATLPSNQKGQIQMSIMIETKKDISANYETIDLVQDAPLDQYNKPIKNAVRTNDKLIINFLQPINLQEAKIKIYKPICSRTDLLQKDYTNDFVIKRFENRLEIHYNAFYRETEKNEYVIKIEDGNNVYFKVINVLKPIGNTILISSNKENVVTPDTAISVAEGESQQIFFDTKNKYTLKCITVNDIAISRDELSQAISNGYFTLINVTKDTIIHFEFVDKYANYQIYQFHESLVKTNYFINGFYYDKPQIQIITGEINSVSNVIAEELLGFTAQEIEQQTIAQDGTTIVNVYYLRNKYLVKTNKSTGVISTSGDGEYKFGQVVTITSNIEQSHNFAPWSTNDSSITDLNSRTLTFEMPANDVTITANATIKTLVINASVLGNGHISPAGSIDATYGSNQKFSFEALEHHEIESIIIDNIILNEDELELAITNKFYKFKTIMSDHTIVVKFKPTSYTITVIQSLNGSISPETCSVEYNTNKTFTITPNWGYSIEKLTINNQELYADELSTYTFYNVNKNCSISAQFTPKSLTITTIINGGHASINIAENYHCFYGQYLSYIITPNMGYGIKLIKINNEIQPISLKIKFEPILEDTFVEIFIVKMYKIITSCDENGSISPSIDILEGDSCQISVNPHYGYEIAEIYINGNLSNNTEILILQNIKQDYLITATFTAKQFIVYFKLDGNCSINPIYQNSLISYNQDFTFNINVDKGYILDKIIINGIEYSTLNNSFTAKNVTENLNIEIITKYNEAPFANFNLATILIIVFCGIIISLGVYLIIVKLQNPSYKKLEKKQNIYNKNSLTINSKKINMEYIYFEIDKKNKAEKNQKENPPKPPKIIK